jgi:hypothetical protein
MDPCSDGASTRPGRIRPILPAWREIALPPPVTSSQTMLMESELRLLYGLARDHFLNVGHIVDAGCFLGGSTRALSYGLAANSAYLRNQRWEPIFSYDLFEVEAWTIGRYFPQGTPPGMSFEPFYRNNIAPVSHLVGVRAGDITRSSPPPNPIEILFIDLAKHWTVSDHLVRHFFPKLIPGHSIVVHQDYLYEIGTGWLPVTMEFLSEYFDLVDHTELNSVAFHYRKAVPAALLERDLIQSLTRTEILDLGNRAIARFPGEQQREILMRSRDDFQSTLASIGWPA